MAKTIICSVPTCDNKILATSFCAKHYYHFRRYGSPNGRHDKETKAIKMLKLIQCLHVDRCIVWPYSKNSAGYGKVWKDNKLQLVHRLVCEHVHGPHPKNKQEAAHSCGQGHKGCCNPAHIFWKSPKENQHERRKHQTAGWKLTPDQVLEIAADNRRQVDIASDYDISQHHVSSIKLGKTWGHVTGL